MLHRYWRLRFTATAAGSSGEIALANVAFLGQDGSLFAFTGLATADSCVNANYSAVRAFAATPAWGTNTGWDSASAACPHWIAYDYGAAVDVRQVIFTTNNWWNSTTSPSWLPVMGAVFVDYSDDGSNWVNVSPQKSPVGVCRVGRTYRFELPDYVKPVPPSQAGRWWNAVPGLTALCAWDGGRCDAQFMFDGVGDNRICKAWPVAPWSYLYQAFAGDGSILTLEEPVALNAPCTVFAMFSQNRGAAGEVFLASSTSENEYALHHSANGYWYSSGSGGGVMHHGLGTPLTYGTMVTAGLVRTGSLERYIINGVAHPSDVNFASYSISNLAALGRCDCFFSGTDRVYALAVFSGAASVADIAALEAAVKAEIVAGPMAPRGFEVMGRLHVEVPAAFAPVRAEVLAQPMTLSGFGMMTRLHLEVPAALEAGKACNYGAVLGRRLVGGNYYTGTGRIVGTVKEKSTPMNRPLRRKVRLYLEKTGEFLDETWSDAATGAYTFTGLDPGQIYTVIGYDHLHNYRAVAADNLTAENMPWA